MSNEVPKLGNRLTNQFIKEFDPQEHIRRKYAANRQRPWTLFATGLILILFITLAAAVVSLSVLHLYPAFRSFLV